MTLHTNDRVTHPMPVVGSTPFSQALGIAVAKVLGFNNAVKSRFLKGVGANAYSQFVSLLVQIISVPILVSSWGVDKYGVWLVLSALPTYLAASNLGVAHAAASEMTILGAGKKSSAQEFFETYHTACAITLLMTISVFLLITALVFAVPMDWLLFGDSIGNENAKLTLLFLISYTLLTLYGGVWDAAFRSTGRYAVGTIVLHSVRLVEQVVLMLVVWIGDADFVEAAFSLMCSRLVGTLIIAIYLARSEPKMPFGLKLANMRTFKSLLPASLGYVVMPIGFALYIQGMILVAASFSASFATLFATTRTLTSLGRQIVSMVAHASWPELSRAFGEGDLKLVRKLFWAVLGVTSLLSIAYFLVIGFLGPWVYKIWIGGEIDFNFSLFLILAASSLAGSLWYQCFVFLASANKHVTFSIVFLVSGLIVVGWSYYLVASGHDPLISLLVLPLGECALVAVVLIFVRKLLSEKRGINHSEGFESE